MTDSQHTVLPGTSYCAGCGKWLNDFKQGETYDVRMTWSAPKIASFAYLGLGGWMPIEDGGAIRPSRSSTLRAESLARPS